MEFYLYILMVLVLAAILLFAGRALFKKREIKFIYCYHSLIAAIVILYLIRGPVPINHIMGPTDGQGGMANILVVIWLYTSVYLSYLVFLVAYFGFSIRKRRFLQQFVAFLILQCAVCVINYFFMERGMFF